MKKRKLILLTLIVSSLMFACGASKSVSENTGWEYRGPDNGGFEVGEMSYKEKAFAPKKKEDRKITFSAYMSLAVEVVDRAAKQIERLAEKYEGYVNETGTERVRIRIKSEHFEQAMEEISTLGKVLSKSTSGRDVTEAYYDNKIRLENAEKARQRYLELLAKAENVEATLKVEKELERLNREIDLYKGKMKRFDHLVAYSTITVNLKERKKPGLLGYIGLGLYHTVKWLFVRN